jgi:hypothetical protein
MVMRFRGGGVGHIDPTQYMTTDVEVIIDEDAGDAGDAEDAEDVEGAEEEGSQMEVDREVELLVGNDKEEVEGPDGYAQEPYHTDAMGEGDDQDGVSEVGEGEGNPNVTDDDSGSDLHSGDDDDSWSLEGFS